MGQLTIDIQKKVLSWMFQNSMYPVNPPQQPIRVHLMSANGNNLTRGTEITGNSYDPELSSWVVTSSGTEAYAINSSNIEFSSLDNASTVTIVGIELWDSSPSPQRVGYAEFDYPISVGANQSFTISSDQIKVRLV